MADLFPLDHPPEKLKGFHPLEVITFYRSCGQYGPLGDCWHLEIRGSVLAAVQGRMHKKALIHLFKRVVKPDKDLEINQRFLDRTHLFLQDSRKGRSVPISLAKRGYLLPNTLANGHFESTVTIPRRELEDSIQEDAFGRKFVQFCSHLPVDDPRIFAGEIELISQEGLSIISDVDDTIKLSNVGDRKELLANTFTREFRAIPGMRELYQTWAKQGVSFHYVSASPWQLYGPLVEWLDADGFPVGSMHLRHVRLRDFSGKKHREQALRSKKEKIQRLLRTYPYRRFILFGDSGEQDALIYGEVAKVFGNQILHIAIRQLPDGSNGKSLSTIREALSHIPMNRWSVFREPDDLKAVSREIAEALTTQPVLR